MFFPKLSSINFTLNKALGIMYISERHWLVTKSMIGGISHSKRLLTNVSCAFFHLCSMESASVAWRHHLVKRTCHVRSWASQTTILHRERVDGGN